ncbi:hypothetical protein F53441_10257 [Fusarium austroafricanum]|uniref:Arrestin C-terminal-like domain-containing protein n=1 Tax=Fusarium austroafricanum TaxID=2364996 RepID=A0A8H4KA18_9HYPO|nr:hypothetical protein F53441_10257 [Fusarium austroafricanum]
MHPPPRNNQPPLPFRPPHISPSHLLGTLRPPSPFHHHLRLRDCSIHPPSPLPFGLPFQSPYSLFEIRLDQDLIVLRGNCDEAQGQVLRGVLVLCLQSPLKLEEVSLDLVGTLHHSWAEPEPLAHENTILYHKWPTFVGSRDNHMTLPAGNYEWPFEYTLPGNAVETVEGMPEARITYRLKATVTRPRLTRDIHARKQFRIFRIPSPDALELMQSTSIERTLKEKVDFSINLSPGAVMLGGSVMLEMRFTPLIKGLDLQHISAALIEFRKFYVQNRPLFHPREYRTERTISTWHFQVSEDQDWQDMLEGTGQEGWAITKKLDISNRLCECIQDTNVCGIKVYHRVRMVISLRNSDEHIFRVLLTLPLTVIINPNMPFDEQSNIGHDVAGPPCVEADASIPPVYGEHILDQICNSDSESFDNRGIWPSRPQTENAIPQNDSLVTNHSIVGDTTLSRSSELLDMDSDEMDELNRVPTYRTALRSPLRFRRQSGNTLPPGYTTSEESS